MQTELRRAPLGCPRHETCSLGAHGARINFVSCTRAAGPQVGGRGVKREGKLATALAVSLLLCPTLNQDYRPRLPIAHAQCPFYLFLSPLPCPLVLVLLTLLI